MNDKEFERFMNKVDKTKSCWNWIGTICSGYGHFTSNKKLTTAHRIMFEHFNGEVGNLDIHHTCKNKRCVNPAHLKAISRKDHRTLESHKKICPRGHIRKDNISLIGQCKTCNNENSKNRRNLIKSGDWNVPKSTETHCRHGHLWKTYGKINSQGNRECRECINYSMRQRNIMLKKSYNP